jgi:hypothetical protein
MSLNVVDGKCRCGMDRAGTGRKCQPTIKPMKDTKSQLDKQALSARWGVSIRSVERIRKRYGLRACGFFGRQPEFDLADVEAMEARRTAAREATLGQMAERQTVITVKEAKRAAKRRAA